MKRFLLCVLSAGVIICSMGLAVGETHQTPASPEGSDSAGLTIFPDWGGQGSTLTITSGSGGFGIHKGRVQVGGKACKIISWSDSAIQAKINKDMDVGTYDVTVHPRRGQTITIEDGFEVVIPYVNSSGPINIRSGETYDISTVNLPPRKGHTFLVDARGALTRCSVLHWTPEMVRTKIPDVAPGEYSLLLRTGEGDFTSAGLFNVQLPGVDWDWVWKGYFNTTCNGIMYGGKVCRFVSGYGNTSGIRYDISNRPGEQGNRGQIVDAKGVTPYTNDSVVPAIIGDRLYVFWTIREGDAFEYTWTDNVGIPTPIWAPLKRISDVDCHSGNRPNVLYYPKTKTTYIYYRNWYDSVSVLTSEDQGENWVKAGEMGVIGRPNYRVLCTGGLSVALNSRGEIMLATNYEGSIDVRKSTDPLKTSYESSIHGEHAKGAPWLQALGQGQVALLWQGTNDYVNIKIYSDDIGSWGDKRTTSSETYRGPTAMPVFSRYTNDPVKGAGLELRLWYFFFDHENVYGREERYLGELRQTEEKDTDWSTVASEMGLPAEEEEQTQLEIIKTCPLVGIVDNPPPAALNGGQKPEENKSSFTFSHIDQTTNSFKSDWKVGIFVTTGPMSPVYADIHVGVQGSFSETTTTYNKVKYIYKPNYGAGKISAIHSVPVTKARKFETYRNNKKIEGVPPIVVLQVLDTNLLQIPVDPPADKRMVTHSAGDLKSYNPTTEGYEAYSKSASWSAGTVAVVEFGETKTASNMTGKYATGKGGYQIPLRVAFGFEGEFSVRWTNETSTSNNWGLTLDNPAPSRSGDVKGFVAALMLFKPSKDPYWIPYHVIQGKDAVWFLTYLINGIEYY